MQKRIIHTSICVKGVLNTWTDSDLSMFIDGDTLKTVQDVKSYLLNELEKGHAYIPLGGKPCEGFSYKTGCPGHLIKSE